MKTLNFELGTLNLAEAVVALLLIACNDCTAQIQQAWVAHYNNGITTGTNQTVKMALDPAGNIYVTGFSQNANTNVDYATVKYAPSGLQVWVTRFDPTNTAIAMPAGIVLDQSGDVIVTGNAATVKYDTNGSQMWTAPYAGTSLAADSNGNVCVVGFSTDFGTVKLSPDGSNVWLTTFPSSLGPNVSRVVGIDMNGNVDVAGSSTYFCDRYSCYNEMLLVQYDAHGNQLWKQTTLGGAVPVVQVVGIAIDNTDNIYVIANAYFASYATLKYASNGNELWAASDPTGDGFSLVYSVGLDSFSNVLISGQNANYYPTVQYGTYKINTSGRYVWTNLYPNVPSGISVGTAISLDQANNSYVTGYSPGTNSVNDIVTIKYDQNGKQIWLQRYNSPGNGNAAGNAIAVDNNGNVYVAGYDTTAAGGTEMVLIKYSPVTVQRRSDGRVILQAQGSPGESFDIQASADLQSWLDLGSVLADTNGLMQFDDTNASNYPSRFYYTNPQ